MGQKRRDKVPSSSARYGLCWAQVLFCNQITLTKYMEYCMFKMSKL